MYVVTTVVIEKPTLYWADAFDHLSPADILLIIAKCLCFPAGDQRREGVAGSVEGGTLCLQRTTIKRPLARFTTDKCIKYPSILKRICVLR